MAGVVLGMLVVITVVTGTVMMGGRLRHEPRLVAPSRRPKRLMPQR